MRLAVCSSAPRGLTKIKKKNTSCVFVCSPKSATCSGRAAARPGWPGLCWRSGASADVVALLRLEVNFASSEQRLHLLFVLFCLIPALQRCAGCLWLVPPQRWNQLQNLRQGCFQSHLQEVSLFQPACHFKTALLLPTNPGAAR